MNKKLLSIILLTVLLAPVSLEAKKKEKKAEVPQLQNYPSATLSEYRLHGGYADADMNDNRLYWDATLTKSWKQGRWVAKLKGYDILGQVSQWQYWVNAQGRTEQWSNNMRRYVLLSLSYRFNVTPKKK